MPEILTHLELLREIAIDQHGLVTTAQALKEGVSHTQLSMMVKRGRLDRVAHGVYRVPQVPGSRWDNWALAVLWTGVPEACLSHETALAAWNISDINPDQIHLCVGCNRRLRRHGGERYVIHHAELSADRRTLFEQIPITDVPTTIEQCIDWGVPTYLIDQAFERAGRTSLLLRTEREQLEERLEKRDYAG